jgi:hypothetical protein
MVPPFQIKSVAQLQLRQKARRTTLKSSLQDLSLNWQALAKVERCGKFSTQLRIIPNSIAIFVAHLQLSPKIVIKICQN